MKRTDAVSGALPQTALIGRLAGLEPAPSERPSLSERYLCAIFRTIDTWAEE